MLKEKSNKMKLEKKCNSDDSKANGADDSKPLSAKTTAKQTPKSKKQNKSKNKGHVSSTTPKTNGTLIDISTEDLPTETETKRN